jgi:hypothetical protein
LRRELTTVDRRFSDRDCKWQRKVDDLQDELNLQQELKSETSSNNYLSLTDQDQTLIKREHEGRHSLRIQVEGLKQTVDVLNKDIEEKNDQMKSCEASLRSEVIIPTKMTSLTKIQLESDRVSNASAEMERRISEDTGVSVNTGSEKSKDALEDDFNDDNHSKNNTDGSEDIDPLDDKEMLSSPLPSPLVRYKSLRDHNGRYCLVVKIA